MALRLQRLLQLERGRPPRQRDPRRDRAALRRSASRPAPKTTATTRPATSTSRTRGPFFAVGPLDQADTIDDNFGFAFNAFPDPFNAPYVRTDNTVPNSQAKGNFVNATGLVQLGDTRRCACATSAGAWRTSASPTSRRPTSSTPRRCPHSNLDKVSARYEAQAVTPWLANLSLTAYYQRVERLLQNTLPVQFPAPTAVAFFPISVLRLDILSQTEQRVWTPGVDLQAVITPASNHVLTTGATFYRDRSSDRRAHHDHARRMVGQVVLGARGPAPVVFPSPVQLGPPSIARPVRVPDAALRDIAVFAQDEWRVTPHAVGHRRPARRLLQRDAPRTRRATTWRRSWPAPCRPSIPSTLPDANGETITRQALTGDIGIVANPGGARQPVHPLRPQLPSSEPRGAAVCRARPRPAASRRTSR